MDIIIGIYSCTLFFPGPLWPLIISYLVFRKKFTLKKHLFIAGVLAISIYTIAVVVPYYFQGYRALQDPMPGEGLGWHRFDIIDAFAYLYTFELYGFLWLSMGLSGIGFGLASKNKKLDILIKFVFILVYSFYLIDFHNYESTINSLLE